MNLCSLGRGHSPLIWVGVSLEELFCSIDWIQYDSFLPDFRCLWVLVVIIAGDLKLSIYKTLNLPAEALMECCCLCCSCWCKDLEALKPSLFASCYFIYSFTFRTQYIWSRCPSKLPIYTYLDTKFNTFSTWVVKFTKLGCCVNISEDRWIPISCLWKPWGLDCEFDVFCRLAQLWFCIANCWCACLTFGCCLRSCGVGWWYCG